MERVFQAIKGFVLKDVNAALPRFEDADTRLPPLTEQSVRFGAIDPLKTAGDTLCAVLPQSLDFEDGYVCGERRATAAVTVAFWCRGAKYEELASRMARYLECFAACLALNPSLGGRVRDCAATRAEFDWDCGVADRQATACLIDLSIRIEEENDEYAAYQKAQDPAVLERGHKRRA